MDNSRIALSRYRIEKARQCLASARNLLDFEDFSGSANRSYYAIFHATKALLALEEVDYKKHSAVISHFQRCYIKSGIFPVELSDIIKEAFDTRSDADYDDFFETLEEDAIRQIDQAQIFCDSISEYILEKLGDK